MFITSFGEQNITYRSCSNLRIHLCVFGYMTSYPDEVGIYLQEYWTIENDQWNRNDKDLGIVILSNEIKTIAFSEI